MRVVVASDLHLVYADTERAAINEFLDQMAAEPPDHLILNGDLYELWRTDLAGNMWASTRETDRLWDLKDQGVPITLTAGNHDGYLTRHTVDSSRYPFDPRNRVRMDIDGVQYTFLHGHQYEPIYTPITDDALSLTDDRLGDAADWIWSNRPALPAVDQVTTTVAAPLTDIADPDSIRQNVTRRAVIYNAIKATKTPGEWVVYGHTHTPFVREGDKIANSGAMVAGQATYLEIVNGVPSLRSIPV